MQNVMEIYHVIQELLTFSLISNVQTDGLAHIVNIVQAQGLCSMCTEYWLTAKSKYTKDTSVVRSPGCLV